MSERHIDDAVLVAFVQGDIDDGGIGAHLLECAACASRLTIAARVEVAMFEAAEEIACPQVPVARARSRGIAAQLALAASLVLGIGMPSRWVDPDAIEPTEVKMSIAEPAPACMLDDGGRCDDPSDLWSDEALAMTIDPRGAPIELGEDALCIADGDGSDLYCTADI
jgi:hypothetical protein